MVCKLLSHCLGKTQNKKKKGAVPRPPPLLLVQDSGAALIRIQERVSALLLRSRSPSPPTPTRRPSCLPDLQKTAPLWQKSALLSVFSSTDFYTPELTEYIVPLETASVRKLLSDLKQVKMVFAFSNFFFVSEHCSFFCKWRQSTLYNATCVDGNSCKQACDPRPVLQPDSARPHGFG